MLNTILNIWSANAKYIVCLLILMGLDVVAGVMIAFVKKEYKSCLFREGLVKKVLEVLLVLVGFVLDAVLDMTGVGYAVLIGLSVSEAYSIVIENIGTYIDVPSVLKDLLQKKKEEN